MAREADGTPGLAAVAAALSAAATTIARVLQILLVTIPFFALIAAGYAAARAGALPLAAIPGLNAFVLYFALPCMLFRFGAGTPIAQLLDAGVVLVWGASALIVVAATVALARRQRIGWNDAAFGALVAAFPNTGFMGVPLLVAHARHAGGVADDHHDRCSIWSSPRRCASRCRAWTAPASTARRKAARQALRGIVQNPMPWAILLGGAGVGRAPRAAGAGRAHRRDAGRCRLAGGPVHHRRRAGALGDAGARAPRQRARRRRDGQRLAAAAQAPLADVLRVAAIKLLLHPLLVYGARARRDRAGRAARRSRHWWRSCWWRRCRARATCRCWPSASAPTTGASRASSCGPPWRPSSAFRWRRRLDALVRTSGRQHAELVRVGVDRTSQREVSRPCVPSQ